MVFDILPWFSMVSIVFYSVVWFSMTFYGLGMGFQWSSPSVAMFFLGNGSIWKWDLTIFNLYTWKIVEMTMTMGHHGFIFRWVHVRSIQNVHPGAPAMLKDRLGFPGGTEVNFQPRLVVSIIIYSPDGMMKQLQLVSASKNLNMLRYPPKNVFLFWSKTL